MTKQMTTSSILLFLMSLFIACNDGDAPLPQAETAWIRNTQNPIYRDLYEDGSYQTASDAHIFYDEQGNLRMIYSGDTNGRASIKMARGNSWTDWEADKVLLFEPNALNLDIQKETAFYRKSQTGKHQIYYIGYPDEINYQAQIFLAESESLDEPFTQIAEPIVHRGNLAGKAVHCITSPSIVEHEGLLYMAFIGWNASPSNVSEVWVIGATSTDDGYTWSDFQMVDTPIGMEGQVTQKPDGSFVAVRTDAYKGDEAIFYATSDHPFGPWETSEIPILVQDGSDLEKDEVIAPQVTFDRQTGKEYLFYTGAAHQTGWWMMLAEKNNPR